MNTDIRRPFIETCRVSHFVVRTVPLLIATWATCFSTLNSEAATKIRLPGFPQPAPLPGVVLFGFDDRAFPYQNLVQTHLNAGRNPKVVLDHGKEGSVDEVLLYYGTVIRIGDTF